MPPSHIRHTTMRLALRERLLGRVTRRVALRVRVGEAVRLCVRLLVGVVEAAARLEDDSSTRRWFLHEPQTMHALGWGFEKPN